MLGALQEIEAIYGSASFDPNGPMQAIWDIVLVTTSTTVINVSMSAYGGLGVNFSQALDIIQALLEKYKIRFLGSGNTTP